MNAEPNRESAKAWPSSWPVRLGELEIALPLLRGSNGFGIYAFDPMGRGAWNIAAAKALAERLAPYDFDILLCAESKSIALAEQLARLLGYADYVVLRKSYKLYMQNPLVIDVKSVTTAARQQFFLGSDQQELLRGRRVCVLDDVISTGGTLRAIFDVARLLEFQVAAIACVLTEENHWTAYEGAPVVSLGHIPLPGFSEEMPARESPS
ncbi:MAG: adenine phosphoribosyltransferase [Oscillospiraceae bacterium]|nr:adenine phosphoribosyltransferase [Oscillospiraceae bacterium]